MLSGAKKKVFIVEDDEFLSSILLNKITNDKIQVSLFKSGAKALEALQSEIPDLLVLDIFLPDVRGTEVLEAVRKDERTKKLRVLVVSNTDKANDKVLVKQLGAEFLLKALVTPKEIVEKIEKAVFA